MLHATKKPILLALLIVLGSIAGCIGNDEEKTELETLTVAFESKMITRMSMRTLRSSPTTLRMNST